MRVLLVLMTVALAVGWAIVRYLPDEARAEPVVLDVRPQEVLSVSLDGQHLPMAALREVLETRVGTKIDLATVQRDRQALVDALVARGYLAAQVGEARVTFGAGAAVYVTFPIKQGPLFRIRDVKVTGVKTAEAGVVTFAVGDVADAARIERVQNALEQRLRVRGKQGIVETALSLDVAAGLVELQLTAR